MSCTLLASQVARWASGPPLFEWLRRVGLLIAVALCVVPAGLLEPRYFVLPIIMAQLHAKGVENGAVRLQLLMFTVLNAATLFVFARKPFVWPNGEVARFMW